MDRKQSPSPDLAGGFFVYDAAERGRREERFFLLRVTGLKTLSKRRGMRKKQKKISKVVDSGG
ncbi:hypothetical protein [uncultured Bilophila sp.]|uniref:hypothetical protein n=1 Tax=uncultured Bilophila sp. TaxID=529385 RepID=UPI0026DDB7F4|nr:hypothetical protein [uncultured Bilophila sp.]